MAPGITDESVYMLMGKLTESHQQTAGNINAHHDRITKLEEDIISLLESGGSGSTLTGQDGISITNDVITVDFSHSGFNTDNISEAVNLYYTDARVLNTLNNATSVGIGLTNPLNQLHVNSGNINIAAQFESTDATAGIMLKDSSGNVELTTSGTHGFNIHPAGGAPVFRVEANGNVGIGTDTPATKLHTNIVGSVAGEEDIARFSSLRASDSNLRFLDIGANHVNNFISFDVSGSTSGNYIFRRGGSQSASLNSKGFAIGDEVADNTYSGLTIKGSDPSVRMKTTSTGGWTWNEYVNHLGSNTFSAGANHAVPYYGIKAGPGMDNPHLVVDANGNVGIGLNNPPNRFTVAHSGHGISIDYIGASTIPTGAGLYTADSSIYGNGYGDLLIKSRTDYGVYNILFYTATSANTPIERMRISPSGNVSIGTEVATARLDVRGGAGAGNHTHAVFTGTDNRGLAIRTGQTGGQHNGKAILDAQDTEVAGASMDLQCAGSTKLELSADGRALFKTTGSSDKVMFFVETTNTADNGIAFGRNGANNLKTGMLSTSNGTSSIFKLKLGLGETEGVMDMTNPQFQFHYNGDLQFLDNGSEVGRISVLGSERISLHTGTVGIEFNPSNQVTPSDGTGGLDNTLDLGAPGFRWDDIYATNNVIQTSDKNEKTEIQTLDVKELNVAKKAKTLLRKFKWIDSVNKNGKNARIHFGIIAQDLEKAFTDEGLDAGYYGMFIKSTWTDKAGVKQTRLGIRYNELLAFIISAI